jgi:hypothetical protein
MPGREQVTFTVPAFSESRFEDGRAQEEGASVWVGAPPREIV